MTTRFRSAFSGSSGFVAARPLARLTTRQVSLEDVFVALTGRHLREEGAETADKPAPRRGRRQRGG